MPSKLEQLKKEIQRLRPEIMELKFGCYIGIKCFTDYKTAIISDLEFYHGKTFTAKQVEDKEKHFYWTFDVKDLGKDFEILGRTITLEDVLAVLTREPSNFEISAWCDGTIFFRNDGKNCVWLLGKPLDDQSEETINFLHSLIVK